MEINDTATGVLTYVHSTSTSSSSTIELAQSSALYTRATSSSFAGVEFEVEAGSLKWSLNFTSTSAASSSDGNDEAPPHTTQWTTVRYRLAASSFASSSSPSSAAVSNDVIAIMKRANTPRSGLTTYYLPLSPSAAAGDGVATLMASVVLFDMALVDGNVTDIRHDIVLVASAEGSSSPPASTGEYEIVVELPPFKQWLHYDPSIGLGVLLGADESRDDGLGGTDNTGLVVGMAVVIPAAIALVLVAIVVGLTAVWWRRKQSAARLQRVISDNRLDGDF
jgi:hypothetical protein